MKLIEGTIFNIIIKLNIAYMIVKVIYLAIISDRILIFLIIYLVKI